MDAMTPTIGWSELDYYRASRAARRASERRAQQLQIAGVLDEEAAPRDGFLVEPATPQPRSPGGPEAGSTPTRRSSA